MSKVLDKIVVAGAGRMGRGIALSFAWAGRPVTLVDSELRGAGDFAALAADIEAGLADEARQLAAAGLLAAAEMPALLARIELCSRADSANRLAAADVVFEAVLELVEVKRETFAWLSERCNEAAIFASTTSTMLADTLAGFVAGPERYMNAHWLNPAYLMPLVEISPCKQAEPATVESLRALLEAVGKVPVVCKASPGYIVSRVQALLLNEAARMVAEGVAEPEDIDRAIRTGFGPRYSVFGALEFIDWGGGDILYYASNYLSETIDKTRFSPPDIVRENMASGRNGMREGQGFYDWRNIDLDQYRQARLAAFGRLLDSLGLLPADRRSD